MKGKIVTTAIILTIVAVVVLLLANHNTYLKANDAKVDGVKTIITNSGFQIVELGSFCRKDGFSASLTFVKFATPQDFITIAKQQNILTVMHYYGNMRGGLVNYHYFFFMKEEVVYRYIID